MSSILTKYVSAPLYPGGNGSASGEPSTSIAIAVDWVNTPAGTITFARSPNAPSDTEPPATGSEMVPSGASVGRVTIKSADMPCAASCDGLYVLKFLTASLRNTVIFQVPSSLNCGKAAVERHVPLVAIPLTKSVEVRSVYTVCAPDGLRKIPPNPWLTNGVSGTKLTPLKSSVAVIST